VPGGSSMSTSGWRTPSCSGSCSRRCTPDGRAAVATGAAVLQARVHRVTDAGRLRVTERRAVDLIRAAGTGVVLTPIDQAEDERDDTLEDRAWESVCATILTDTSTAASTGPATAACSATGRFGPGTGVVGASGTRTRSCPGRVRGTGKGWPAGGGSPLTLTTDSG
jgi:hypothetical protein